MGECCQIIKSFNFQHSNQWYWTIISNKVANSCLVSQCCCLYSVISNFVHLQLVISTDFKSIISNQFDLTYYPKNRPCSLNLEV